LQSSNQSLDVAFTPSKGIHVCQLTVDWI
jgi:hypothetical protein